MTDFRRLFAAAAASTVGTQISFVAVPLLAITVLGATPAEVGALGVLKTIAFLLVGLPAGAWLDRVRRRGVMIAADLTRAALLLSVPVAWWLGVLTIWQLYAVVLLAGVATLFFDVAALSYLPFVVGRDRLIRANAALQGWDAGASTAGPSIGGYLVQVASAPVAILVDGCTYLWSAILLTRIKRREPPPAPAARRMLLADIREGVRFVAGHPMLRPIALVGVATNLFLQIAIIMVPFAAATPVHVGLFFTAGGVGVLLGSLSAGRLSARYGLGRLLTVAGIVTAPGGLLLPGLSAGAGRWWAMAGWLALTYRVGVNNVLLVTVRQTVTPDRLLSRMNATMRFLMTGVLAVGAAIAGGLGQFAGIRVALWVAGIGLALSFLPLLRIDQVESRTIKVGS
jgi:MFS family permease